MSKYENVFKNDEYKSLINPITDYVKQTARYLSIKTDNDYDECVEFVKSYVKRDEDIVNPKIKYFERDENLDRHEKVGNLMGYINKTLRDGDILTPPLTAYLNHNKGLSFQVDYIFSNVKERKKYKTTAFNCKTSGDIEGFRKNDVLQKRKKISNNSVSGSYASEGTMMYNPSAHYTLTSITRCVASLGNAVAESMIAGNRHYRDPQIVMNHLISMIEITDYKLVEKAVSRFKLKIPTVDDVMGVIRYSTDLYWTNEEAMKEIEDFVKKMSPMDRVVVTYVNDLYHLRVFNGDFVKKLVDVISEPRKGLTKDALKEVKELPEHITNHVHHVLSDKLAGQKIDYAEMVDSGLTDEIASTGKVVLKAFDYYKDLFKAFFVTDNIPISVAYLPDILRRVTVLSDTDSTCATYQEWTEWFFGEVTFGTKAIGVTAGVMTMVTQVLDHILNQFTTNMNVDKKYIYLLAMKNEFYWNTMTPMDVSKHYFADTYIQEGNVYGETDLEKKGVHMMASKIPKFLREASEDMMKEVSKIVRENKKIDITKYIKKVADLEREVIKKIENSDTEVLQLDKIKEADSYTLTPDRSPYLHYLMWNEVFAGKYGECEKPPYRAVRLTTKTDTKKKMEEYLDSLENRDIAEKLKNFLKKYGKNNMGTFRLPHSVLLNQGLPEELMVGVDVDKILSNNLNIFYMMLGALGFYKPDDVRISDMGY